MKVDRKQNTCECRQWLFIVCCLRDRFGILLLKMHTRYVQDMSLPLSTAIQMVPSKENGTDLMMENVLALVVS